MADIFLVARLLLGIIFGLSAILKLVDLRGFAWAVSRYEVLPPRLSVAAALLVIAGEAIAAASLLSGIGAAAGLVLATLLLTLFAILMMQNSRRPEPLPCYCFGATDAEVHPGRALARLGLLLTAGCVALVGAAENLTAVDARPTLGSVLLALTFLVLGVWILRTPELVDLRRTRVPPQVGTPRRVSLRGAPLQPVRIDREGRSPA